MGPTIIFDKSVLQSLSINEAVILDHLFLTNITPIFFVETLADLEKPKSEREPERMVRELALKTPDFSSKPNVHHTTLLAGELTGAGEVDMKYGRPHIGGGRYVKLGNETGVIFKEAPEEIALSRWNNQDFSNLERSFARAWRKSLSNINFEQKYKDFQDWFTYLEKPKDLVGIKKLVDYIINDTDQDNIFRHGLSILNIPEHSKIEVLNRWEKAGKLPIRDFAPYFTYVFSVDLFFYLAIAANLIGRERPSHKIDISYLYYLPFCQVFTSYDKLHIRMAPFFLRKDQTFILGSDLKKDLAKMELYFDKLPDEIKDKGVVYFASHPPIDEEFLIARLWDKYMASGWRDRQIKFEPQPRTEISDKLLNKMKRFQKEAENIIPGDGNKMDNMMISRMVRGRKGKWQRFPPEIRNRRKNESGEWKSIQ